MDTARARLRESMRRHDPHDRFRMYHPVTAKRAPNYVHSKLMIIGDQIMRVGSSNFNNRSMRYDNECDVAFEARDSDSLRTKLRDLRNNLLGEHLGVSDVNVLEAINRHGSVIAAVDALRQHAIVDHSSESRTLVPYETPELSDLAQWLADNEILDPEGPEDDLIANTRDGTFGPQTQGQRAAFGWRSHAASHPDGRCRDQYRASLLHHQLYPSDGFEPALTVGSWVKRLCGFMPNAVAMETLALCKLGHLEDGNPEELGDQMAELAERFPHINVWGGCCGTDGRHIGRIAHKVGQIRCTCRSSSYC